MIAIGLAALTVIATTFGGLTALRSRDRFHLVLGLSAGLLLGLVAFDLIPEFSKNSIRRRSPCTGALMLGEGR